MEYLILCAVAATLIACPVMGICLAGSVRRNRDLHERNEAQAATIGLTQRRLDAADRLVNRRGFTPPFFEWREGVGYVEVSEARAQREAEMG